jgi:hypothetical protein
VVTHGNGGFSVLDVKKVKRTMVILCIEMSAINLKNGELVLFLSPLMHNCRYLCTSRLPPNFQPRQPNFQLCQLATDSVDRVENSADVVENSANRITPLATTDIQVVKENQYSQPYKVY